MKGQEPRAGRVPTDAEVKEARRAFGKAIKAARKGEPRDPLVEALTAALSGVSAPAPSFKYAGPDGLHPTLAVECPTCGAPAGCYCNDDQEGVPRDRPHDARKVLAGTASGVGAGVPEHSTTEGFPVMLRPQDCDAILAVFEVALNAEPELDFGSGIRRWQIEEAGRRVESVADLARRGMLGGGRMSTGTTPTADLKDELFDAVRRAYVGDKPWHAGPAHLGLEVPPEAVAIEPQHARAISRIHEAVCNVLDGYEVVE